MGKMQWGLVCLALIAGWGQVQADEPALQEEAVAIIEKMSAHYQSVNAFHVDLRLETNMAAFNMKETYTLTVERPNRLALHLQKGMMGGTVVSDGQKLTAYSPMTKKYLEEEAPANMILLCDQLSRIPSTGTALLAQFLPGLIADDPAQEWLEDTSALTLLGEEELEGQKHHKLEFVEDSIKIFVWIAAGEEAWVSRIEPDLSAARPEAKDLSMVVAFTHWTQELPEMAFDYTPPQGAVKSDSLAPKLTGGAKKPSKNAKKGEAAKAMVGEKAPTFTVGQLGSQDDYDLSQEIGQKVIVLDFWATWCPPCKRGLPILDQVTKGFADRGVSFHAVNIREKEARVASFMDDRNYNFSVLLDTEGAISELFKVAPIPQTVIIDKAGVIRYVHIGLLSDLEGQLTEELEGLLAEG